MAKSKKNEQNLKDIEQIKKLKADVNVLGIIYEEHKEYCLAYMRSRYSNYRLDGYIEDIYSEAVNEILYNKVMIGHFELDGTTLRTYLCAVCRNQLLKKLDDKLINGLCIDNPLLSEI